MKITKWMLTAAVAAALTCGCIFSTVKTAKKVVHKAEDVAIDAVRDILKESAEKAAAQLSVENAYADDAALRIVLPDELKDLNAKLSAIGMADEFKKLEAAMNRAAVLAAKQAVPIFSNVIRHTKVKDVHGIVSGSSTAATKYLRKRSWVHLRAAYLPIIKQCMSEVKAVDRFNKLRDKYNALPTVNKCEFSVEDHVTDRALLGLFARMGRAEKYLRKHPSKSASRTVRKVFR